MVSYLPFLICFLLVLVGGTFLNFVSDDLGKTCEPNTLISSISDLISSDWEFFSIKLNPLSWIPGDANDYISSWYSSFCLLPDFVTIPFFIVYILSFFILILSILKDVIPFT